MKKLMFGMAAALALCGMAIESSNVVGYNTTKADDGKFYIMGIQFEQINGSMVIDGLVSGTEGVSYDDDGTWMNTASQIQVPSALGYDIFYYLNDGWYDNGTTDGDFKPGWCDARGEIVTTAEFTPGVSVWFKSKTGNCDLQQAGQVPSDASVDVACAANVFQLKAGVFPVAFGLNDEEQVTWGEIKGVDYDDAGVWMNNAPQIQVPSALGYDIYYYLNDGWYDNGTADGDYKAGWCDARGEITDVKIPVGQGFWVKPTTGAFTITFKKK